MSFDVSSLQDVAEVVDSLHKTPIYADHGFPMVRVTDVKYGILNLSSTLLVDDVTYIEFSRRYKPASDDIVITRVGTYGVTARVTETAFCLGQNTAAIVPKTISSRYLYAVLNSEFVRRQIEASVVGSTQKTLSLKHIKALAIPRLGQKEEAEIAETIGALDDRVTLLRETNATLEAIAQALFKSWFVDFDPVRAKLEGRTPEGMEEATAALFPDGFEASELGLVPRGWRVKPLDEVANFLNGLALQKFPPMDDAWLPVIKIAQLRKGDTVGADRAGRNLKPVYVIQNGDVLFSWSGSLEVEVWCGGEGALNQHLFKVTSDKYPKWFYYLWTKHHLDHFRQIAASKATTMGHIQRAHLSQAKVVVPPDVFVSAVGECFGPLLDRWIATALQAQTLATLRDTLLPRLISGQLRLPETL